MRRHALTCLLLTVGLAAGSGLGFGQTEVKAEKGLVWADFQISIHNRVLQTFVSVQVAPDSSSKEEKITFTLSISGPKNNPPSEETRTYKPGALFSDNSLFSHSFAGWPDGEYTVELTIKDLHQHEKKFERLVQVGAQPAPPVKSSQLVFYEGQEDVNVMMTASMSLVLNFESGAGLVYRGEIEVKPLGKAEFPGAAKIVALGVVQTGPDFVIERPLVQRLDPAALKLTGTIEGGNPERRVDEIFVILEAEYPPPGPNLPNRVETKRLKLYRNKDK
jgi:hypothetical protein